MNKKHDRTLEAIYKTPVQSNVPWKDCVALPEALGAEIEEGAGSRVRIALKGVRAVFHIPLLAEKYPAGLARKLSRFNDRKELCINSIQRSLRSLNPEVLAPPNRLLFS